MKWARCRTLTESIWRTAVRARVRLNVRIVGTVCRGSRNPWATRVTLRAWARVRTVGSLIRSGSGDVEQLLAHGVHHGLHARVELELLQDVADVVLHGVLADEQSLRDLAFVEALRHELEDLELAVGQPGGGHLLTVRARHLLELVEQL